MASWATPYFVINFLFLLAYTGLIGAWVINWFKYRTHASVALHKYIGATVAMQLLISLVLTIYYGMIMGGRISLALVEQVYVVVAVFGAVASGILYSVLILIAKGYCIVSPNLSNAYKASLSVWVIIFVFLRIIGDLGLVVGFIYYLIAFIVFAMFLAFLFYVFKTTIVSIRVLQLCVQQSQEGTVMMQPVAPNANQPTQYPQNIQYPPAGQYSPQSAPQSNMYANAPAHNPDYKGDVNPDQPPPVSYVAATAVPAAYPPQGSQVYYAQAVAGAPPAPAVAQPPTAPAIPDAPEKLKLMVTFHRLMIVYIVLTLILNFLPDFAPRAILIFAYLQFLLVLLFLVGLCIVFRMRVRNHYFYVALDEE